MLYIQRQGFLSRKNRPKGPQSKSGHFVLYVPPGSFFPKQNILNDCFQSCNKSLINLPCSGPYWENIGPRSFMYGPRCARSVLSRPRADILPVRPSRLVNKTYVYFQRFNLWRVNFIMGVVEIALSKQEFR